MARAPRRVRGGRSRIGDVTVRDQTVALIVRDGVDVPEGDGLLPLHLFASVSFNTREQCLVIRRD